MLSQFGRRAVATLLKFAKTTSDPGVAAALVDKAADMTDREEGAMTPIADGIIDKLETKKQTNDPRQ